MVKPLAIFYIIMTDSSIKPGCFLLNSVPESFEGSVVHSADPVVPEVEAPEVGQLGDGLRGDLGEGVGLHGKVLQL